MKWCVAISATGTRLKQTGKLNQTDQNNQPKGEITFFFSGHWLTFDRADCPSKVQTFCSFRLKLMSFHMQLSERKLPCSELLAKKVRFQHSFAIGIGFIPNVAMEFAQVLKNTMLGNVNLHAHNPSSWYLRNAFQHAKPKRGQATKRSNFRTPNNQQGQT